VKKEAANAAAAAAAAAASTAPATTATGTGAVSVKTEGGGLNDISMHDSFELNLHDDNDLDLLDVFDANEFVGDPVVDTSVSAPTAASTGSTKVRFLSICCYCLSNLSNKFVCSVNQTVWQSQILQRILLDNLVQRNLVNKITFIQHPFPPIVHII
jgi:hypothetical protein